VHAALVAVALFARSPAPAPMAPAYKVDLVAAPRGERRAGVVDAADRPTAAPRPATATPPPGAERVPTEKVAPVPRARARAARPTATPSPSRVPATGAKGATAAPRAGGGADGGTGSDVVTVRTDGIDFPYPGYLANIVRQIALNFRPRAAATGLRADVRFLIHRDGSISDLVVRSSSGNYGFDLDARGAVEAAGAARAFGPLPGGYRDDVLTVFFSFDPRVLR
jgi:protein TonB